MASQIDKFNQRYGNRKKTGNSPKGVDFAEQFNASEQYKKAKDMGIDLSGFSVDSEESLKRALIEVNKLITEKETKTDETNTPPSAENKDDQKKDTPDKDDDTLEIDEAGGDAKENLEVFKINYNTHSVYKEIEDTREIVSNDVIDRVIALIEDSLSDIYSTFEGSKPSIDTPPTLISFKTPNFIYLFLY